VNTSSREFETRPTHLFVDKSLPPFSPSSSPFPEATAADELLVLLFAAELLPEADGVACSVTEVPGS